MKKNLEKNKKISGHLAVFQAVSEGTFFKDPSLHLENSTSARLDMRVRGSFSATVTRAIRCELRDRNWTGKENRQPHIFLKARTKS